MGRVPDTRVRVVRHPRRPLPVTRTRLFAEQRTMRIHAPR